MFLSIQGPQVFWISLWQFISKHSHMQVGTNSTGKSAENLSIVFMDNTFGICFGQQKYAQFSFSKPYQKQKTINCCHHVMASFGIYLAFCFKIILKTKILSCGFLLEYA